MPRRTAKALPVSDQMIRSAYTQGTRAASACKQLSSNPFKEPTLMVAFDNGFREFRKAA